jgi:glycerol-1-phosphatase
MTTSIPAGSPSPDLPPDALLRRFDALLFDLDGVVYVGPEAVPHAADVIAVAGHVGLSCAYVTNNASRSAESVAAHLVELGVPATADDVVTSPQAAVSLLPAFVPAGARVLVIGGPGIDQALADRGYVPVRGLADEPAAVLQGFSPDLSWRDLAEATFAVRAGLPWIATNPDLTFPTPRGVAPGNGSLVEVVARTAGRQPDAVAGKPEPPLLTEAVSRTGARRPLMIGDRLDTDIAAGARVDMPSLLVFTGVTTLEELMAAVPAERPQYLGADLRVLLAPYPAVDASPDSVGCGGYRAERTDGRIEVTGGGDPWDAVRAVASLAWQCADAGRDVDTASVAASLTAAIG